MSISEDLANAEGIKTFLLHIIFMLLMTVIVAFSIRIIGILLITSMLIIPAAAARQISATPILMAIFSSIIGMLSVILGIFSSIELDTPSGPTIVCASVILFILTIILSSFKKIK